MAHPRADRTPALAAPTQPPKPVRRTETSQSDDKAPFAAVSRANQIVRAIGLRPITGLSGPKIGY